MEVKVQSSNHGGRAAQLGRQALEDRCAVTTIQIAMLVVSARPVARVSARNALSTLALACRAEASTNNVLRALTQY